MPSMEQSQAMASYLKSQKDLIDQLLALLPREKEILLKQKPDVIDAITQEKSALLEKIEKNDLTRQQILSNSQLQNNKTGMTQFIQQSQPNIKAILQKEWEVLRTALEDCMKANINNGIVINACQANTQGLLSILQGQAPNSETNSYNKKGKKNTGSASRGSASA